MGKTINAIKEKAALLNAYADVLEDLENKEHWYQHKKVIVLPGGEEQETDDWEDDESEYATTNLLAIRNVVAAVRKLAGV